FTVRIRRSAVARDSGKRHAVEVRVGRRHVGSGERSSDRRLDLMIGSISVDMLNLGVLVCFLLLLEDRLLLHFAYWDRRVVADRLAPGNILFLSLHGVWDD